MANLLIIKRMLKIIFVIILISLVCKISFSQDTANRPQNDTAKFYFPEELDMIFNNDTIKNVLVKIKLIDDFHNVGNSFTGGINNYSLLLLEIQNSDVICYKYLVARYYTYYQNRLNQDSCYLISIVKVIHNDPSLESNKSFKPPYREFCEDLLLNEPYYYHYKIVKAKNEM